MELLMMAYKVCAFVSPQMANIDALRLSVYFSFSSQLLFFFEAIADANVTVASQRLLQRC